MVTTHLEGYVKGRRRTVAAQVIPVLAVCVVIVFFSEGLKHIPIYPVDGNLDLHRIVSPILKVVNPCPESEIWSLSRGATQVKLSLSIAVAGCLISITPEQ